LSLAAADTHDIAAGDLSLQADADWQAGRFDGASMRVQMTGLRGSGQQQPLLPAFRARFSASTEPQSPRRISATLQSVHSANAALARVQASAQLDLDGPRLTLQAGHIAAGLIQPLLRRIAPALAQAHVDGDIRQAQLI